MPDLAAIRDWVREQAQYETDDWSDTKLNNVVNQGLRIISARYPWPWLLATTTLDTIASQQSYTIASDFLRLHSVLPTGVNDRLDIVSPIEAFETWGDNFQEAATATSCFLLGSKLYLVPIPSTTATAAYQVHYVKRATIMSNDTDTPEFDSEFHLLLAEYGVAKVWEREEDFTKRDAALAQFDRGVQEMAGFYLNRTENRPMVYGEPAYLRRGLRRNLPWLDDANLL